MTNALSSIEVAAQQCEEAALKGARKARDPRMRTDSVVLEIRPGAGGEEAGLFARDLLLSYQAYAKAHNWKWEVIGMSMFNDKPGGAIREATVNVVGPNAPIVLEYESGVHRVQRVPSTEKAGKVHTSTVGLTVLPVPTESALSDSSGAIFNMRDIKIEVMRASGAGGQHVNTTNSKVWIGVCSVTHVGIHTLKFIHNSRLV
jgi:peptide chain release factor 1